MYDIQESHNRICVEPFDWLGFLLKLLGHKIIEKKGKIERRRYFSMRSELHLQENSASAIFQKMSFHHYLCDGVPGVLPSEKLLCVGIVEDGFYGSKTAQDEVVDDVQVSKLG